MMKKYNTPEIEFEMISTSDICVASTLMNSGSGEAPKLSWSSGDWTVDD